MTRSLVRGNGAMHGTVGGHLMTEIQPLPSCLLPITIARVARVYLAVCKIRVQVLTSQEQREPWLISSTAHSKQTMSEESIFTAAPLATCPAME